MVKKFKEKYGDVAIITGASSGIGKEFAYQIAAKGLDLILIARRKEELEKIKNDLVKSFSVNVEVLSIDLTQDGFQNEILEFIKDKNIGLLVNNAGMNCEGHFYRGSLPRNINMIKLNVEAPFILAYEVGKILTKQKRGGIIFTSSVSAFNAHPYLSHYAATKAYILSLAESLNYEFKGKNVDVLALCPGMTKSEMTKGMKEGPMLMEAKPVVEIALNSLGKEAFVVPGMINKTQVFLNTRILNRNLSKNLMGNMLKKILPGVK
ncbi:MAG: SDR family NAD(P)-dependent oxidoreductase [Chitinophagales bacterium]|nr:SDR family NAD(P)-dependent oxidoreductase [Chitinophagales bacterium]